MTVVTGTGVEAPFLGLRYFDEEHAHLFFGRDVQVNDILDKLRRSRLVTVMGSSGSGKSSLVRAGVVPRLKAGLLGEAGPRWRIAKTRPGSSPIASLARELERALAVQGLEVTLRRGPLGLEQAVAECRLAANENVLVIADQFEELFRYQREAHRPEQAREEAAAFVKLLLEATNDRAFPIYVVVTMRSDYLGNCAQFRDLPERINEGLYLVPRMRRDQLEQAISGPIAVEDAEIEPRLLQRLLNETGDDPDQLPVLQHALLRTWNAWNHAKRPLDLEDLDAVGGMKDGLSRHADEIYQSLSADEQRIARVMFQQLSERDPEGREIRRPTPISHVAAVAATSVEAVDAVVRKFAAPEAALLYRNEDGHLDITHESLIRKWVRFQGTGTNQAVSGSAGWLQEEAEARDQFLRFVDRATRNDPLMERALDDALAWRALGLSAAWSRRYAKSAGEDAFERVTRFIEECRTKQVQRRRVRRWWQLGVVIAAIVALSVVTILWRVAEQQKDEANRARADAVGQRDLATAAREDAREQARIAVDERATAEQQRTVATEAADRAEKATVEAQRRTAEAEFATLAANGGRVSALAQLAPRATEALVSAIRLIAPVVGAGKPMPSQALKGLTDAIAAVGFSVPENHLLRGHKGAVESVTLSPDGRRILTSGADGTARLWDAATLALVRAYDRPRSFRMPGVTSSSFSPDSRRAVLAVVKGFAVVDAATGEIQRQIEERDPLFAGFSHDGTRIITTITGSVRLSNAATGDTPERFDEGGAVLFAALSPDNKTLAYGGQRQVLVIRNLETGDRVEQRMGGWVLSGAFAPTGGQLLVASENATLLWDVQEKRIVSQAGDLERIDANAFSDALVSMGSEVRQTGLRQDLVAKLPRTSGNDIVFSALSRDGTRVVTAVTADEVARVWNASNGALVGILRGHTGAVRSAAFTPDGRRVVTASTDGTARAWDLRRDLSLETVATGTNASVFVARSPDGRRVVSVSESGDAVVWTPGRNALVRLEGKLHRLSAPVFSVDSRRLLAACEDDVARMWDADTGRTLTDYRGHKGVVRSAALSPDGTLVVTGGEDATVRVWDAGNGRQRQLLSGHTARVGMVQFSPDGRRIVTAGVGVGEKDDYRAFIWSVEGKRLAQLEGPVRQLDAGAFSSDGRTIVGEGESGSATIWDVQSARRLMAFDVKRPFAVNARFSPDGSRIVTTGSDGVVQLWSTQPPRQEPVTLRGDSGEADEARWSPDGKRLLVYGRGQDLQLWDAISHELLVSFAGEHNPEGTVAFMPDGLRLVAASGSQLKIYAATAVQFLTRGCDMLRNREEFKQVQALCPATAGSK
jgi:WD40 repeat protein